MSEEKRLTVEMTWTMTKKFTVTVPPDTARGEIEDILYDCDVEFLGLDHATMPCVIDSEEIMEVVERAGSEIEFQNFSFEEVSNG
jgi:hypothetical protein